MATNHEGHRDRMRQKFLKQGLSTFEEHEVLEMLLFYAIPRKNTNEIAHELINKFGNLAKVFDADIEILQEVKGVSQNSAVFIKMIPQMCKIYFNSNNSILDFKSKEALINFAIGQYIGETEEILKALYLNSDCCYIACDTICTMSNASVIVLNIKKIIERAEKYNSNHIVLLHNHPTAECTPSEEDKVNTLKAERILKSIGITLIDHVIVSKKAGISMRYSGYLS